jgi:hypothetical protein
VSETEISDASRLRAIFGVRQKYNFKLTVSAILLSCSLSQGQSALRLDSEKDRSECPGLPSECVALKSAAPILTGVCADNICDPPPDSPRIVVRPSMTFSGVVCHCQLNLS